MKFKRYADGVRVGPWCLRYHGGLAEEPIRHWLLFSVQVQPTARLSVQVGRLFVWVDGWKEEP